MDATNYNKIKEFRFYSAKEIKSADFIKNYLHKKNKRKLL